MQIPTAAVSMVILIFLQSTQYSSKPLKGIIIALRVPDMNIPISPIRDITPQNNLHVFFGAFSAIIPYTVVIIAI